MLNKGWTLKRSRSGRGTGNETFAMRSGLRISIYGHETKN